MSLSSCLWRCCSTCEVGFCCELAKASTTMNNGVSGVNNLNRDLVNVFQQGGYASTGQMHALLVFAASDLPHDPFAHTSYFSVGRNSPGSNNVSYNSSSSISNK